MIAWALYAMSISLCLGAAALAAERANRLRRRPTRWIWLGVMIASVVIPAVISFVIVEVPDFAAEDGQSVLLRLRDTTLPSLAPATWVAQFDGASTSDVDEWFARLWTGGTVAMLLLLLGICIHWLRRTRAWELVELRGHRVYVADDVGPAVIGFFRPCIVLPRWIVSAGHGGIDAVLAHEREHVEARDPHLLLASLVFIVAMPWNLPLWWVVLRLRRAIEIDCDARVVSGGRDAIAYGSLLLDVNQRRGAASLAAIALTGRHSFLETRIRIMLATRSPAWRWMAAACALVCIAMIALAAHISPPSFLASQRVATVDDGSFDALAGYYHFGGDMVMHVRRSNEGRFVHLAGQRPWEIRAKSKRHWVSKSPYGEYEFAVDARGDANGVTFRQNGNSYSGRRVSASFGMELQRAFVSRVDEQRATAGTQEAVRHIVAELQKHAPDYARVMPGLAARLDKSLIGRRAELQAYGALENVSFVGVSAGGSDIYRAEFERGTDEITIRLAPDGRISRLDFEEWSSTIQKDAAAERYQRQKPYEHSEAILGRLIETIREGKPSYGDLSPGMAATVREQLASLQLGVVSFGALRSVTFDRVAPNGWDVFSVRFDRAVIACSIELRHDGKVTGLIWDM